MLDRAKLMRELRCAADNLFFDLTGEISHARSAWEQLVSDPTFVYKIKEISSPWLLPDWSGELDRSIASESGVDEYQVVAVDGSQIYPDKHQGTMCSLINIGTVMLNYGLPGASVFLSNRPYLFKGDEVDGGYNLSPEWINCKRQEYEFLAGFDAMQTIENHPVVFLFDGSLIFWHLESKEPELKNDFLTRYLSCLERFYKSRMLIAGYISLPKSKELVNLIRVQMCNFDVKNYEQYPRVDHLVDTNVVRFFLKPFERTIIFKSSSSITAAYPDHLKPHFFYLDVGTEIARIEVPAWIITDEQQLNKLIAIILDQCVKGDGYPVCLAESHEQAVVKGPDRDFFYSLIAKVGFEQKRRLTPSAKSMKKRGIGI